MTDPRTFITRADSSVMDKPASAELKHPRDKQANHSSAKKKVFKFFSERFGINNALY